MRSANLLSAVPSSTVKCVDMRTQSNSLSGRTAGLLLFAIVLIAALFLFTGPIPQDPAYHNFADTRTLLGIPNFWNVASNLPFALVGLAGLVYVLRHADKVCVPGLETTCGVFFAGILLTAFGSAYYHVNPSDDALVWDRLPMTISFAGLFCIIVGEFLAVRAARLLLIPMLLLGFASVEYWALTEAHGVGDLRPYAIVQFLPMLLIPLILLTHRSAVRQNRIFWWIIAFYFMAKFCEMLDARIYAIGELLSGHSLKHLVAAMAPAAYLYGLKLRRQRGEPPYGRQRVSG